MLRPRSISRWLSGGVAGKGAQRYCLIEQVWPSKTDSAPVRDDGYEPESSKFRLRANAEASHSVRYDMVVVVASIVGGGGKFSHGMVRYRRSGLSLA